MGNTIMTPEKCPICAGTGKIFSKSRGELICKACLGKGIKDEELLRRWREYEQARLVVSSRHRKRGRNV